MLRAIILKVEQYKKSVSQLSMTIGYGVLLYIVSSWAWAKRFLVFQNDSTREPL